MLYRHPGKGRLYRRKLPVRLDWLIKRGKLRQAAHYSAVLVIAAVLGVLNFWLLHPAAATPGGYKAAKVIGQQNFESGTADQSAITTTGFDHAAAMAVDTAHHRLFVADTYNNRVMVFDTTSGVSDDMAAVNVLGQPNLTSSGCSLTATGMCTPQGLAYDSVNNRLFVSDAEYQRVVEYDLSGGISNGMAASHVIGQPDLTTWAGNNVGCFRTATSFCSPDGLAYDNANKRLYVSDGNNCRVLEFDISGGISDGMAAAHVLGEPDFTSCSPSLNQRGIARPSGLYYDQTNQRLYVMDNSYMRLLEFDTSGGVSDNMLASHVLGEPNFTTNSNGTTQNQFGLNGSATGGIAYDNANSLLYVMDPQNNRALVFDLSGGISDGMNASHVLGQLNFTSNSANSNQVNFDIDANTYSGDDIVFDPSNSYVYVGDFDNNRLMVFDTSGGVSDGMLASHVLGQGGYSFAVPNDAPTIGPYGLDQPWETVSDSTHHRVFVSDTNNNRILVYDTTGGISDGMAASHVLGQPDFNSNACDPGHLCEPHNLYYDSSQDRLFVSDTGNNRVLEYDLSGGISDGMAAAHVLGQSSFFTNGSNLAPDGLDTPEGLVYVSASQKLFVADSANNRVLEYDLSGGISDGMAASHVLGQPDFVTNNAASPANAIFNNPQGLTYDPVNNYLFVAAENDDHIDVFNVSGGVSDQMAWSWQIGRPDPGGAHEDDMARRNLDEPIGVNYDSSSHLMFVSDSNNSRVLAYNLSGGVWANIPPVEVLGSGGNAISGYPNNPEDVGYGQGWFFPPSAYSFRTVTSATYDSATGNLYVTDSFSNRVLVFANPSFPPAPPRDNSGYAASDVLGQTDLNSSSSTSISPNSTVIDTVHHRLFVLDDFNLIKEYDLDSSNNLVDKTMDHYLGHTNSNGTPAGPDSQNSGSLDSMAIDQADNRLYVGDATDNRVLEYDLSGGISDGMAASHVLGQANFTDTGCSASQTSLCRPYSMAFDPSTKLLYVGDDGSLCPFGSRSGRVMIFDTSGAISDGMPAIHEIGAPSFTTFTCAIGQNSLAGWVDSLAVDSQNHRLFVGDDDVGDCISRLLVFDTSNISDGMNATHELGLDSFTDVVTTRYIDQCWDDTGSDSQSFEPDGLIYDSNHNVLFVEDGWFGRLMAFDVSSITDGMNAFGVIGDANFDATNSFSTGSANALTFNTTDHNVAFGFNNTDAYDPTNNRLYISDGDSIGGGFDRVMIFNFIRITTASLSDGNQNQPYSKTVSTANSHGTVSYSISSGALPAGVVLAANTGQISGTPTQSGSFNFTVKASDNNTSSGTFFDTKSYSINVAAAPGSGGGSSGGTTPSNPSTPSTPPKKHGSAPSVPGTTKPPATPSAPSAQAEEPQPAQLLSPNAYTGLAKPVVLAAHRTVPPILKFVFPWLLFILLAIAAARLAYQSWRERQLRLKVMRQLEHERALTEERNNFIALSSHYLRTPITAITGGIELLASMNGGVPGAEELKALSQNLANGVNELLARAGRLPAEFQAATPRVINPMSGLAPMAAGFVQNSFLVAIMFTFVASVAVICIADAILKFTDIYNVTLVNFMIQLAAMIAASVFFWGALRSHHKNKLLREQAERQLQEERDLDSSRNGLIKGSLQSLRQPLAELKAKLEPLAAANPQTAGPALSGVNKLNGLLGKFTILTSLETSTMGVTHAPIDLAQMINETAGRYAEGLRSKNLSIANDLQALAFSQDPLLVSFMLDSLISNAIKYSPEGQVITVSSETHGNQVQISVKDNGPGIPEEQQAELFQPFSRAEDAARDFNKEGAGLSLYLDKLVTKYLGGSLSVNSHGQGTTASFSLPATSWA